MLENIVGSPQRKGNEVKQCTSFVHYLLDIITDHFQQRVSLQIDGYEEVEEVSLKYFIFLRFSILAMQVEQNGSFRVRNTKSKAINQSRQLESKQASMQWVMMCRLRQCRNAMLRLHP